MHNRETTNSFEVIGRQKKGNMACNCIVWFQNLYCGIRDVLYVIDNKKEEENAPAGNRTRGLSMGN